MKAYVYRTAGGMWAACSPPFPNTPNWSWCGLFETHGEALAYVTSGDMLRQAQAYVAKHPTERDILSDFDLRRDLMDRPVLITERRTR